MAKPKSFEAIRDQIAALQAERARVEAAPATRAELLAKLDEVIARQAAEVAGYLIGVLDDGPASEFMIGETKDGGADRTRDMLCAICPDHVRAWGVAQIDRRLAKAGTPMPSAARSERLAELEVAIHQAEIAEEQAISYAEESGDGSLLPRRPALSPAAFFAAYPDVADALHKVASIRADVRRLNSGALRQEEEIRNLRNQRQRLEIDRANHPGLKNAAARLQARDITRLTREIGILETRVADGHRHWQALLGPLDRLEEYARRERLHLAGAIEEAEDEAA